MIHEIELQAGMTVRLPTAGKYCDRDIVVTAKGGGGSVEGIPGGYTKVDYIQFNDLQTVDTGIICNQDTKLRVVFTRESTAQRYMYGVTDDSNLKSVTAYLGGTWRFGNKSASKGGYVNANNDIIYTVIVNKNQIHVPNNNSTLSGVNDFETDGTLLLGACRVNGAVQSAQFIGKIFFFELWQGDTRVLKLVPVTDGTVFRFWDDVGKKFLDSITDTPLDGGNL